MISDERSAVPPEFDANEFERALVATAAIGALCAVFIAFAPSRDPSNTVAGLRCSVVSENAIAEVLHTPVRLMPSDGTVCHYISTGEGASRSMFVIAKHESIPPAPSARDAIRINGVGDAAQSTNGALLVRYGHREFAFVVVPQTPTDTGALDREIRVAKLVHNPMVAQAR